MWYHINNSKFAFAETCSVMLGNKRGFMKKYTCIVVLAASMAGCSTYQKALKTEDTAYKVAVANDLFEKGKYNKAINLYDAAEKKDGWKPESQLMYVNYAKAQYKTKKYESLSGMLKKFNALFPTSVFREEMLFLEAMTLYQRSEDYTKDQLVTYDGIQKFQEFIAAFPESEKKAEAEKYNKELVMKLEQKAFENAKLYNQIGEYTRDYNAAIVALDNFMMDYPGSEFKEDALFYKFDSAYNLAINSVYSKMEERLNNAVTYYNGLVSFKEDTKYKEKADHMLARIENELKQFSNK